MLDPVGDLVQDLRETGSPSYDWLEDWSFPGLEPLTLAWSASGDGLAKAWILAHVAPERLIPVLSEIHRIALADTKTEGSVFYHADSIVEALRDSVDRLRSGHRDDSYRLLQFAIQSPPVRAKRSGVEAILGDLLRDDTEPPPTLAQLIAAISR